MLYIIIENGFDDAFWSRRQHTMLFVELKKKRLKYREIATLEDILTFAADDDMPVVAALGATTEWLSSIVKQCNDMNVRIIALGNTSESLIKGNCSLVLSDLRNSAADLYKYFTSYNKENVLLYSVNPTSRFDMELKNQVSDYFPAERLDIMESNSGDDVLREQFFENCFCRKSRKVYEI